MDKNIVSPFALWKDYNPEADELHISVVKTTDEGSTVTRGMYFDAYREGAVCVRAYAELKYTHAGFAEANGYMPAILMVGDLFDGGERDCVWQMTNAGYAVLSIDFIGDLNNPRSTIYPSEISYARFLEAKTKLYSVGESIKRTPWYVWTVMAQRAVTLLGELDEVDATRVGAIGLRNGGNLVANLASFGNGIKCAAIIGNTGWRTYSHLYGEHEGQVGFFDEEYIAYNCSLSVESYAQFITKPTLFLLGTNDVDNDFDRAFDTYARKQENLKCALSVSPRADGSVRFAQLGNLRRWMDCNVLYREFYPTTPEITAYVSKARQYVRVTAAEAARVTDIAIYYAYNEEDYRVRNWYEAHATSLGEGIWIASLDIAHEENLMFCFAVVTYDNGVTISTKQIAKRPALDGVVATSASAGRLVYDSAKGIDCFTVIKTGGLFDYREELELRKGPLNIVGIQAIVGELATFKFADQQFAGYEGDLLSINYYCMFSTRVALHIGVMSKNWKDYTFILEAAGGEVWQKVTLALTDFKDESGQSPESWESVARFSLARERGKTFLVSTLLWA